VQLLFVLTQVLARWCIAKLVNMIMVVIWTKLIIFKTKRPAVGRIANRTAWRRAFFWWGGGAKLILILGEQDSIGCWQLYRWIGR